MRADKRFVTLDDGRIVFLGRPGQVSGASNASTTTFYTHKNVNHDENIQKVHRKFSRQP